MAEPMFEYANYYERHKTDNDTIARAELHAIHFGRLIGYRKKPHWNIYKILLFEYLLLCHRKYGDNFTHKTSMIEEATRLSKNSIKKYRDELERERIISVRKNSERRVGNDFLHRYSINFDHIMQSLDQIYDFGGQSEDVKQGNIGFLQERYRYIRDHTYGRERQKSYFKKK